MCGCGLNFEEYLPVIEAMLWKGNMKKVFETIDELRLDPQNFTFSEVGIKDR